MQVPSDVAHKLHISAFEAINDVIQNSAMDSMQYVCEMVPHLIQRISATFNIREEHLQQRKFELQGQLCAALQVLGKPKTCTFNTLHMQMILCFSHLFTYLTSHFVFKF